MRCLGLYMGVCDLFCFLFFFCMGVGVGGVGGGVIIKIWYFYLGLKFLWVWEGVVGRILELYIVLILLEGEVGDVWGKGVWLDEGEDDGWRREWEGGVVVEWVSVLVRGFWLGGFRIGFYFLFKFCCYLFLIN